jgi:hypothetical protein
MPNGRCRAVNRRSAQCNVGAVRMSLQQVAVVHAVELIAAQDEVVLVDARVTEVLAPSAVPVPASTLGVCWAAKISTKLLVKLSNL